jgi:hypothetical protein
MVTTTEPPEGKLGILPLIVLPDIEIEAGQAAPPAAEPQVAVFGVRLTSKMSLKLVLFAALGPVLLINRV